MRLRPQAAVRDSCCPRLCLGLNSQPRRGPDFFGSACCVAVARCSAAPSIHPNGQTWLFAGNRGELVLNLDRLNPIETFGVGMDRSQKADLVDELKAVFAETSVVVVTRNLGLSVA